MTEIAPPNPPFVAARWHGGTQTPKLIVIHGTVSPCAPDGARSVARFFATEDNKTSAHYVRDPLETIQCVRDHTVAFHCGYNQDSIGYELCDPQAGSGDRWADKNHKMMLAGAAKDTARLCLAYGIPAVKIGPAQLIAGKRGICGHADMSSAFKRSTHTDPGANFPWAAFIEQVKAEILKLKGVTAVEKPTASSTLKTSVKNDWREGATVDTRKLSQLRKTGEQPLATIIAKNEAIIEAAMGEIYKALG